MNRALAIIGFGQTNKPLKSIEKAQDWCAKSVQSYQWRHWTQVNGCHFVAYIEFTFAFIYWGTYENHALKPFKTKVLVI